MYCNGCAERIKILPSANVLLNALMRKDCRCCRTGIFYLFKYQLHELEIYRYRTFPFFPIMD